MFKITQKLRMNVNDIFGRGRPLPVPVVQHKSILDLACYWQEHWVTICMSEYLVHIRFKVNLSDRQDGLTVSSIICDYWWHLNVTKAGLLLKSIGITA